MSEHHVVHCKYMQVLNYTLKLGEKKEKMCLCKYYFPLGHVPDQLAIFSNYFV